MSEETIFAAALELPSTERSAYLAEACGGDAALRQRLEGLLAASDRAGHFMARPAVGGRDSAGTEIHDGPSTPNDATVTQVGQDKPGGDDEVPLGFLAPAQRPDSIGRIGHYEVLQVLGKGGFGIVFRAFDEVLQRVVAVKVLAPQLAATSPARKRFLREARTSAAVRHENVVQVYEVGEAPLPYIAMEFIPGETLQQRLDRIGPVDPVEVVRIGRQIAEGLAAAHANDLIHRDIKPGNILLEGGQQKVKITDFGLARAADDASISQSGIIAGTPMYMAPEQAKGETLDQRADLFSLGSVLYQMAAGRPPFRANSTVAVLKRVADDTPRDIREIIPETPQWLCDIIAKLHAKNPDDRYQSAREVADVLADCEVQLKANAKLKDFSRIPKSKPLPNVRDRRRRALLAIAMALVLVVTLTGMWIAQKRIGNIYRSVADESTVEVATMWDPSVEKVIVKKDGESIETITSGSSRVKLPPGRYRLQIVPREGYRPSSVIYDVTGMGPSSTVSIGEIDGTYALNLARGDAFRVFITSEKVVPVSAPGFVSLFNGNDLTGWKTHPDQHGDWKVVSGVLVGSTVPSYLFSDGGAFENFHLRVEAKINRGGDSGIFFRAPFSMRPGRTADQLRPAAGYEAEIQANPANLMKTGSVWDAETVGSPPKALWKTAHGSLTKADEWFTLELIAQGSHFITIVNGTQTADCSDPLNKYGAGHLALQVYSPQTTVEFRKIEIKELPSDTRPSPPLAVAPFDAAKAKELQEAWAKHLGVPVELTNAIGMKLRLVPPGKFQMGSSEDEIEPLVAQALALHAKDFRSETPRRLVEIPAPFYLGQFELTVGQFRKFVEETGHKTTAETNGKGGASLVDGKGEFRPEWTWRHPDHALSDNHPVVEIDLRDANAFCAWLSKKDGRTYVVPDEQHWEFACRAGTTSPWYGRVDALGDFAWNFSNYEGKTHTVGGKLPNAFGLHDMLGNVDELCRAHDVGVVGRGGMAHHNFTCVRCAARRRLPDGDVYFRRGVRVAIVGDLKAPVATQEPLPPPFKNSIGMEFVLVPKGKSRLGGGSGVVGEHGVEPVRDVEIAQDFYLGKYEVTQEEWQNVMDKNPSSFVRTGAGKDAVKDVVDADLARFPVENVSWDDCQAFISRVNEQSKVSGWVYRLPTQAEWEYACRGGPLADRRDSTFDYYGEKPTNHLRLDQANIVGKGRTCKVGSYKPNRLGLYDMHGNVWEWCEDLYDAKDPAQVSLRAIRGGCWVDGPENCRAAVRHGTEKSLRSHYFGLRLARVPSGNSPPEAKTPTKGGSKD